MDQEPDVIKHDIEQTASSLKEKVEQLEEQVIGTVKGTTEAVSDTVENVKESVSETIETVKETVQDTVESVKRTFNLKYQTEQHPWLMMTGSMVAGFGVGKLFSWGRSEHHNGADTPASSSFVSSPQSARSAYAAASAAPTNGSEPGLLSRLFGHFDNEINQIKEMAIGTLVGMVRDMAKNALPTSLSSKVDDVMNRLTTKLGGEPIRGPVTEAGSTSH